jgi:hypothetical protein
VRRPAPLPGQHTREVLAESGLTDAEITALERAGLLHPPDRPGHTGQRGGTDRPGG